MTFASDPRSQKVCKFNSHKQNKKSKSKWKKKLRGKMFYTCKTSSHKTKLKEIVEKRRNCWKNGKYISWENGRTQKCWEQRKAGMVRQVIEGGGVQQEILRGWGGANGARSGKISKGYYILFWYFGKSNAQPKARNSWLSSTIICSLGLPCEAVSNGLTTLSNKYTHHFTTNLSATYTPEVRSSEKSHMKKKHDKIVTVISIISYCRVTFDLWILYQDTEAFITPFWIWQPW